MSDQVLILSRPVQLPVNSFCAMQLLAVVLIGCQKISETFALAQGLCF